MIPSHGTPTSNGDLSETDLESREEQRERQTRALDLLRHRLPGLGQGAREQPAWLVWLVLFVCFLFPMLVVLAD